MTTSEKVAAEDVIRAPAVYKRMLKTVHVEDIRMHEVSYLVAPSGQDDPTWAKRMASYWMLQELTYGLRMTDFTMVVDYAKGTVRSYAGILAILPGDRVDAESWELDGHSARVREQVQELAA